MAPSKNEDEMRMRNEALVAVFRYTDANLGRLTTKDQQDAAFEALIGQHQLHHRPNGSPSELHTPASLRRTMQTARRGTQKNMKRLLERTSFDELFAQGSKVFSSSFLKEIDFDRGQEEGDLQKKDARKPTAVGKGMSGAHRTQSPPQSGVDPTNRLANTIDSTQSKADVHRDGAGRKLKLKAGPKPASNEPIELNDSSSEGQEAGKDVGQFEGRRTRDDQSTSNKPARPTVSWTVCCEDTSEPSQGRIETPRRSDA